MRAAALALTLVLVGACARRAPGACDEEGGKAVGTALLAFLSRARSAHHRADALEEKSDWAAAEAELEAIPSGPKPPCATAAEVREVLADTRARLGDLRSRHGAFERALTDVEQGLAQVPEQSYFRGHLLETRGLIEERHAKALAQSGATAEADAARARALEAFQEAMRIQSAVIEQAAPKP
jgi:tetratricopeptide (TPR) repeat protein